MKLGSFRSKLYWSDNKHWLAQTMGYSKLVVVVSVLVSKRISSSLTIPTVLTRLSSLPLSTFRCTKRMLSQKERVESEVLAWR